jgi:hypothetical protein
LNVWLFAWRDWRRSNPQTSRKLTAEGHRVIQKGKRFFVEHFERVVVAPSAG